MNRKVRFSLVMCKQLRVHTIDATSKTMHVPVGHCVWFASLMTLDICFFIEPGRDAESVRSSLLYTAAHSL